MLQLSHRENVLMSLGIAPMELGSVMMELRSAMMERGIAMMELRSVMMERGIAMMVAIGRIPRSIIPAFG